jgi:hypothetical protein
VVNSCPQRVRRKDGGLRREEKVDNTFLWSEPEALNVVFFKTYI